MPLRTLLKDPRAGVFHSNALERMEGGHRGMAAAADCSAVRACVRVRVRACGGCGRAVWREGWELAAGDPCLLGPQLSHHLSVAAFVVLFKRYRTPGADGRQRVLVGMALRQGAMNSPYAVDQHSAKPGPWGKGHSCTLDVSGLSGVGIACEAMRAGCAQGSSQAPGIAHLWTQKFMWRGGHAASPAA